MPKLPLTPEEIEREQLAAMGGGKASPSRQPSGSVEHRKPVSDADSAVRVQYGGLYFVSFMLPLVGLIVGIAYVIRRDDHDRRRGIDCLIWALVGIVVGSLAWLALDVWVFETFCT